MELKILHVYGLKIPWFFHANVIAIPSQAPITSAIRCPTHSAAHSILSAPITLTNILIFSTSFPAIFSFIFNIQLYTRWLFLFSHTNVSRSFFSHCSITSASYPIDSATTPVISAKLVTRTLFCPTSIPATMIFVLDVYKKFDIIRETFIV